MVYKISVILFNHLESDCLYMALGLGLGVRGQSVIIANIKGESKKVHNEIFLLK